MKNCMDMAGKYLNAVDGYLSDFHWQDAALFKACVGSLGIFVGMLLPKKWRKAVLLASFVAFAATLIPLMVKMIPAVKNAFCGENE